CVLRITYCVRNQYVIRNTQYVLVAPTAAPAIIIPAAATTTAPATATATATATASSARALLAGTGLIDGKVAVVEHVAIEHPDSFLGTLFGRHLHEPEPLGAARVAVGYQGYFADLACF